MKIISPVVAIALFASPGFAHHSFQMFDPDHPATLAGTVREFRWANPHAVIVLATATANWTIELTSPGNLKRFGWSRHALKPGDKVRADILPLRDGDHGGALLQVRLATGEVLSAQGK